MQPLTGLRFLNLVSFLFVLLARVVWYETPTGDSLAIMPASFIDAIFGVVYTTLLIWCIRPVQAYPADRTLIFDISGWFMLTMLGFGASSIIGPPWELVSTTISFISLCIIYIKIQHHPNRSPWMRSPFSVFLAWSSVQVLILPFRILQDFRFDDLFGLTATQWVSLMLLIFASGALCFVLIHADWVFGLVIIWYYIGLFFNERLNSLQQGLTIGIIIVLMIAIIIVFRKRDQLFSKEKRPISQESDS
ncbi:hypothetical protein QK289_10420 [Exiguobacterium antarcticum]|uniref:YhhN-like protein n=1 Tax=Exiguobacterium antarcticum TaxID=132920 RepID=A0ABT6R3L3_9BACL|nr:hypothetical protein [Exiguobacterium antarcticum]MDI3235423.1 hypothetical protein [Exiguobacterium antarcticum]